MLISSNGKQGAKHSLQTKILARKGIDIGLSQRKVMVLKVPEYKVKKDIVSHIFRSIEKESKDINSKHFIESKNSKSVHTKVTTDSKYSINKHSDNNKIMEKYPVENNQASKPKKHINNMVDKNKNTVKNNHDFPSDKMAGGSSCIQNKQVVKNNQTDKSNEKKKKNSYAEIKVNLPIRTKKRRQNRSRKRKRELPEPNCDSRPIQNKKFSPDTTGSFTQSIFNNKSYQVCIRGYTPSPLLPVSISDDSTVLLPNHQVLESSDSSTLLQSESVSSCQIISVTDLKSDSSGKKNQKFENLPKKADIVSKTTKILKAGSWTADGSIGTITLSSEDLTQHTIACESHASETMYACGNFLCSESLSLLKHTVCEFAKRYRISFHDCLSVFEKNGYNLITTLQELEVVALSESLIT